MTLARLLPAAALLLAACGENTAPRPSGGPLVANESEQIAGATASETIFTIAVPEGTGTLRLLLTGGTGDADLVVRYGARPEPGLIDCVSESTGNVEECIFDLPTAGTWYILIYGFQAYTDVRILASVLPQSGSTTLTSGVAATGLSGGAGSFRMFAINVPAGADSLRINLDATGDVDLYVSRETFPLLNQYDCASFTTTSSETCLIAAPEAGIWYVRVEGFDPFTAGSLTATVTLPPP